MIWRFLLKFYNINYKPSIKQKITNVWIKILVPNYIYEHGGMSKNINFSNPTLLAGKERPIGQDFKFFFKWPASPRGTEQSG